MCQDVDQDTGEDLNPNRDPTISGGDFDDEPARNPDRPISLPLLNAPDDDDIVSRKRFQRISSPEKWEIKQVSSWKCVFSCYHL